MNFISNTIKEYNDSKMTMQDLENYYIDKILYKLKGEIRASIQDEKTSVTACFIADSEGYVYIRKDTEETYFSGKDGILMQNLCSLHEHTVEMSRLEGENDENIDILSFKKNLISKLYSLGCKTVYVRMERCTKYKETIKKANFWGKIQYCEVEHSMWPKIKLFVKLSW